MAKCGVSDGHVRFLGRSFSVCVQTCRTVLGVRHGAIVSICIPVLSLNRRMYEENMSVLEVIDLLLRVNVRPKDSLTGSSAVTRHVVLAPPLARHSKEMQWKLGCTTIDLMLWLAEDHVKKSQVPYGSYPMSASASTVSLIMIVLADMRGCTMSCEAQSATSMLAPLSSH